eukprot:comp14950_c0_seq1/m.11535 comp14950_c0_seq1/g.11535  ORF comp14950_c0_seq1/g.11535 comp14950_c0_seq1/m.11535 type:complete len:209 (-) comp14950_c0_seq1:30-656(-)
MAQGNIQVVVRDWNLFFKQSGFSWPRNGEHWFRRLESNVLYYQYNYLYCAAVAVGLAGLQKPTLLLGYAAAYKAIEHILVTPQIMFGGQPVTKEQAAIVLSMGLTILFYILGGKTFFNALLLTILGTVLHASFRKRTVEARVRQFWSRFSAGITERLFEPNGSDDEGPVEQEARLSQQEEQRRTHAREAMRRRKEEILAKYASVGARN